MIGYARASTRDRRIGAQVRALTEAGCSAFFWDKVSRSQPERPALDKCLEYLRPGDTLVIWRLDRLGRSRRRIIAIVTELDSRAIGFRSLHENIDTTGPEGAVVVHSFRTLAEFERDLIVERAKAGLAAAKAHGSKSGRKPVLTASQVKTCKALHAAGNHTIMEIAETVGCSRATVYRALAVQGSSASPKPD